MSRIPVKQLPVDLDDLDQSNPTLRASPTGRRRKPTRKKDNEHIIRDEILRHAGLESVTDRMGAQGVFTPTLNASKFEREWILDFLGRFYDDKVITDVLRLVKGGKEATVYCCAGHPGTGHDLLAAKIYRPRAFRQLRNDARYRQGRAILNELGKTVRDERMLRAVRKKTTAGQETIHTSWLEHEYQTLEILHRAGADVPQPIARGNSTILMEYFGTEEGPAPLLQEVSLDRAEAQRLFQRLLHNVALMLDHNRIHGDLSAFNVLYLDGDIRIIDFPQVVQPRDNAEAFDIFQRDVLRLCQYFARQGVASNPRRLAADLWAQHVPTSERRTLPVPDEEGST